MRIYKKTRAGAGGSGGNISQTGTGAGGSGGNIYQTNSVAGGSGGNISQTGAVAGGSGGHISQSESGAGLCSLFTTFKRDHMETRPLVQNIKNLQVFPRI